MLVALALLLVHATVLDAPELAPDVASLVPEATQTYDEGPSLLAGLNATALTDDGAGPSDVRVGLGTRFGEPEPPVEDPTGEEPQRLAPGAPFNALPDAALHVGLPCLVTHGDMVSGSVCPGAPFASPTRVTAILPSAGNVSEPEPAGELAPWRWTSDESWPLSYGVAEPQPDPVPITKPRSVPLAPEDDHIAPAPVPVPVGLAWVGRAAAMLAPTVLLAKLLASFAVRRRRRESPARDALLALVAADPGIHYMELVRRSGLGNGTVQHHLRSLLETGQLVRVRTAGHACFFPDATGDPAVVAVRAAARSAVTRQLLARLEQGPRTLSGLAAEAQLPISTVHYHVAKLTRAGALAPQRVDGRRALALTPLGRQAMAPTEAPAS